MENILIIEDNQDVNLMLAQSIKSAGYGVKSSFTGIDGLNEIKTNSYSLVLLDIMLPYKSGDEILKEVRQFSQIPIIIISAKDMISTKIDLLKLGADDYITKPFIVDELVARVKAHLRREKRRNSIGNNIIKIGEIEIHKDSYEVYLNKELIDLSTREFQLFLYLCENAGQVLSREQIFNSVWGSDFGDIGTVAVNIKSLRDKIDKENKYIKTIWGVGYKLIKPIGEVI